MKIQYSKIRWQLASKLSLLVGLSLLTACSSGPLVRDYVAPVNECCTRISDFQFRPILLGQEFVLEVTSANATYQFVPGHNEHFIAFSMPSDIRATAIQTKSFLSTDYLPKSTTLFPDFIFLNDRYQEIGRSGVTNLQERGDFWGGALAGNVKVPAGARYFIIVAGKGDGSNYYHSANGNLHLIPAAALGKIAIKVYGEAAAMDATKQ